MEVKAVVMSAWGAFATKITTFLPDLIGAIIIFVGGWLLAKLLRLLIVKFLRLIRIDSLSEKTGVKGFLEKGNIQKTLSQIVGMLVYWFFMILVLIASLDALGLVIVSDMLDSIFLYIPNVVAAIIVLILGLLFGNLLAAAVKTAAGNAGLLIGDTLGKISLYAIVFFAGSIALLQLGIGEAVVAAAFIILFGATALALALAFGLGGKDAAAELLKAWMEKKKQ